MCTNLHPTTLQNIQTIINAKRVLVAELTKSTNKLIATLRNRVQLAVSTEAQDNLDQEKQLTSNDAIMQKWIRNSEAGETGLEARLDRIEERVKRRQVRARVKFRWKIGRRATNFHSENGCCYLECKCAAEWQNRDDE